MLSKILSSVGVPWLHPSHLNQHRKGGEGGESHVEAFRNLPIQVVRWKMFYLSIRKCLPLTRSNCCRSILRKYKADFLLCGYDDTLKAIVSAYL